MSSRLRVGVIGTGYLGRFHAEKYASMPEVELVGVADKDLARAKETATRLKTRPFGGAGELLEAGVDAVSVVVPTHVHHPVTIPLLEAGVDCLVEKPFAVTLAEADAMIAMAQRMGRVLQVGHLERFNPVMLSLKDRIRNPMFVESHRLAQFGERGTEVDVVLDLMIHDLDIILMAVGSPVTSIDAVGIPVLTDKIDIANARLEFENGCVANVTASRVSGSRMRKIRLFQSDCYLGIDYQAKNVQVIRRVVGKDGRPEIGGDLLEISDGDALAAELASFVQACKTRGKPEVTGEDGRKALALAHAILDAIRARVIAHKDRLPAGLADQLLAAKEGR